MPDRLVLHPKFIGGTLDRHLEEGGFRMGTQMYSNDDILFEYILGAPIYWARYNLFKVPNSFFQKFNKLRGQYAVECHPLDQVSWDELEHLFSKYSVARDYGGECLLDALVDKGQIFDSWVVLIKNGNNLIAAGIFDKGNTSLAPIKNIYDPQFSRQSLGIFLLHEQINCAYKQSFDFVYPGYIAPGITAFDYKILPDFTEILDREANLWLPYAEWKNAHMAKHNG
jgi:hypothetical protein